MFWIVVPLVRKVRVSGTTMQRTVLALALRPVRRKHFKGAHACSVMLGDAHKSKALNHLFRFGEIGRGFLRERCTRQVMCSRTTHVPGLQVAGVVAVEVIIVH